MKLLSLCEMVSNCFRDRWQRLSLQHVNYTRVQAAALGLDHRLIGHPLERRMSELIAWLRVVWTCSENLGLHESFQRYIGSSDPSETHRQRYCTSFGRTPTARTCSASILHASGSNYR